MSPTSASSDVAVTAPPADLEGPAAHAVPEHLPRSATAGLCTRLLALGAGFVVIGLIVLLWFGIGLKERGTSGEVRVPFTRAPDFELGLFSGDTFRLSDELSQSRPVFVNFWASWCVPCRDEAPVLQNASQQYAGRLTIVGVDVEDTQADALAFLKEFGITYPNGDGNAGPISVTYGMRGVPESYFISTDGRVLRKWNGPLSTAILDQFVGELLAAAPPR